MANRCLSYSSPLPLFGLSWSCRSEDVLKLAVSSVASSYPNELTILRLDQERRTLERVASTEFVYPLSKVQFLPSMDTANPDLIATCSDSLRLFECDPRSGELHTRCRLSVPCKPAPLTSLDWCAHSLNIIMTAGYDTTVTLWDIYKQEIDIRFVAQEKTVTDCCFSMRDPNIFLTSGAEGSIRCYDRRRMHVANEVYSTDRPILRAHFRPSDTNSISCIQNESPDIVFLDLRNSTQPVCALKGHQGPVNGFSWGRDMHGSYLVSVAEDHQALIWEHREDKYISIMSYTAPEAIASVDWSWSGCDWIALTFKDCVQVLHV
ncbi:WD40 repeat protein [Giardia muris]|uniref:WD40 repeat protein n=1 Tax=Giardia muris TaxID=5742 RepID=A0A4Z1SNG2_GIAMU|nr:WD40 repeat protein [Giardia muris]|eukprot:TNJ27312.1 WD40 repeat protein [Giardia muris]